MNGLEERRRDQIVLGLTIGREDPGFRHVDVAAWMLQRGYTTLRQIMDDMIAGRECNTFRADNQAETENDRDA